MKGVDRLSEKMLPIVSKMSSQRHLLAIRDSFIVTMPLVMAASVMVLLNALIFSNAKRKKKLDPKPRAKMPPKIKKGKKKILTKI
ncbi:hypothetical protein N8B89_03230 [Enterococcus faecium]